jgi:hypothetical protein
MEHNNYILSPAMTSIALDCVLAGVKLALPGELFDQLTEGYPQFCISILDRHRSRRLTRRASALGNLPWTAVAVWLSSIGGGNLHNQLVVIRWSAREYSIPADLTPVRRCCTWSRARQQLGTAARGASDTSVACVHFHSSPCPRHAPRPPRHTALPRITHTCGT